jgi:hypothetical protein
MACNAAGNIKIQPRNALWEIEEKTCIEVSSNAGSVLDGKSFKFWAGGDTAKFYVLLDEGSATDPAYPGFTKITAAIVAEDSAAAIATAIKTAVDANSNFVATASGSTVNIACEVAADTTPTLDVDTDFIFTRAQEGGSTDLGLLEGDISTTFSESTFEVFAHQYGTTLLSDLRQGVSVEVSMVMQESDPAKLKAVFSRSAGGTHTPLSGTELWGWGTSRLGTSTIIQARRLILKPVNAVDESETLCFWKAYAMPDSLTISGENPQTTSIAFKVYRDESKPSAISYFSYGDYTQLVP